MRPRGLHANEMAVPEALAGCVAAEIVRVDSSFHHIVPMLEHLIRTFKSDDGHECLARPWILGQIARHFFGNHVERVEAPLVVVPALHGVLQILGKMLGARIPDSAKRAIFSANAEELFGEALE